MTDAELEHAYNEHMAAVNRPQPTAPALPFDGADLTGMPAGEELGRAERRAVLGVLPRKSLWPELEQFNQRITDLQARQLEVESRLQRLHERRADAPSADAQAAADWEFAGRQGPPPEPSVDRIDQDIADAERERDGIVTAIDRALEERGAFVVTNRDRLARVAAQQADMLLARLHELFDEVEATRDKLGELRAAEVWARVFPHDLADRQPQTRMLGGGLKQAGEPLGLSVQIEYMRFIEALRRDSEWLRNAAATNEQRALLEGRDPSRLPGTAWADSDEHTAERQAELQAAIDAFRGEWGRDPTESQLVAFIEARRNEPAL